MKIKVGLRQYDIVKQDEIVEVGGELYGKHDPKASEIKLASKFDQLQQNATFLHEITHAICVMQDLSGINEDEHAIELLSAGLHRVIVENPHIFTMQDI